MHDQIFFFSETVPVVVFVSFEWATLFLFLHMTFDFFIERWMFQFNKMATLDIISLHSPGFTFSVFIFLIAVYSLYGE